MLIRRAIGLLCYWSDHGLQVARPGRKERIQISGRLLRLLSDLDGWKQLDDIESQKYNLDYPGMVDAIGKLARLQIVQTSDSSCDDTPETPETWHAWGPFARHYHTVSKDANYVIAGDDSRELDQQLVAAAPMPAQFKSYDECPVILLPRAIQRLDTPLSDVLTMRRTHRSFREQNATAEQLSTILHYTFGPQRFVNSGLFGTLQMKTSPSAGSRHEAECYVVPLRIDGMPFGVYHYDGLRHALEQIDGELQPAQLGHVLYDQQHFLSSAFICFTTAVVNRLTWKYRHPRAYRLWMMDAGHYAQTFSLVSTSLGLGALQSIAFRDSALEELLQLQPDEEFGVYVLAAGHPTDTLSWPPERYVSTATDISIARHIIRSR